MSKYLHFCAGLVLAACTTTNGFRFENKPLVEKPIVIAHRGASGYLPEHTLESYTKAIEMGADFIEPDLVSTKDGILIARHENEISETTDVAKKFPSRKTKKQIDGKAVDGYFTEDFTLAEIKTLRAKERLQQRSHTNDGKFLVPTWEEVVVLVQDKSKQLGRIIGLYPETKHPTYFRSINLPLEEKLVGILNKYSLSDETAPIFIQSFEPTSLKRLSRLTSNRLIQLLDGTDAPYDAVAAGEKKTFADMATQDGLKDIKNYAHGVGAAKSLIIPVDSNGIAKEPTKFVEWAHKNKLLVHAWTFRSDAPFLAKSYNNQPRAEYDQFFAQGVDGVFSDFPDAAIAAREVIFAPKKN